MASTEAADAEMGSEGDANSVEEEDEEMLHSSKLLRIRRQTQVSMMAASIL
jgi:hypothetical protein